MIFLRRFWRREDAQDLVEYTLLIALVVLGSAGLMLNSNSSISKVWTSTSSALAGKITPSGNGGGGGDSGDHDH
jgi:Flp pilus assembly pilin Flp